MEPIIVYSASSCSSSKKTKNWLDEQGISYMERNVSKNNLSKKELVDILKHLPNGLDELFSYRSSAHKKLAINIEECSLHHVLDLMIEHPTLLRKPIIKKGTKISVGFNEEALRTFIPKTCRRQQCKRLVYETALGVSF